MVFPFTFNFAIPGLVNPFASTGRVNQTPVDSGSGYHSKLAAPAPPYHQTQSQSQGEYISVTSERPTRTRTRTTRANLPKITRPRPSPSPSPAPAPLSRKRGWEPSFAEPSRSTTTLASTNGYLDTPAKYREMAMAADWHNAQNGGHAAGVGAGGCYRDISMDDRPLEGHHDEEDMPPLKKRRGLAGSIVSSAISAALIGTAVGLTVYRLWRDRGKESQQQQSQQIQQQQQQRHQHDSFPPPPPYESHPTGSGAWQRIEQPAVVRLTPPTPRKKGGRAAVQVTAAPKRAVAYARRSRARAHGHASPVPVPIPVPQNKFLSPRPEFEFGRGQGEEEEDGEAPVEDKMDWIGDKLSMLIEQGKRALNAEVVVMSDAKEDEVDDGCGAWEEEDEDNDDDCGLNGSSARSHGGGSRSGSVRRAGRRARSLIPASASASASPRKAAFEASTSYSASASGSSGFPASYSTPSSSSSLTGLGIGGVGMGMGMGVNASMRATEDGAAWESPELRESMDRARERMMARRAAGGGGWGT